MRELGTREKEQPPPPRVVWNALQDPATTGPRVWLRLQSDEQRPTVVESTPYDLIVWSSLWPHRPRDLIRFEITGDGRGGSRLRWTLLTPDDEPDAQDLSGMRHRLNGLINAELRYSFGS